MKNKGIALTYVILVISLLLSLGIGLASIIFSTTSSLHAQKEELYAFYLAEGALETGKTELDKNPAWYTDLPHHGNIIQWLKTEAKGLQITPKEEYNIKIVKEYNIPIIYGMGFYGKSCVIIKFQDGNYEEL